MEKKFLLEDMSNLKNLWNNYYVARNPKVGDMIRWIIDYKSFISDEDLLYPHEPIYEYGIIIEIANDDPYSVAVASTNSGKIDIIHMIIDGFEVISKG